MKTDYTFPNGDSAHSLTWRVTPDLIGILNSEGHFEQINPAWEKVLGWTVDEIRGRNFISLIHPDDVSKTTVAFEKVRRGKPALNFENRYKTKDNDYKWLSWVAVLEDEIFYCSARDITEQKKQQNIAIMETEASELREQFIAVLGHDLRNPLASISSGLRMLKRELPDTELVAKVVPIMEGSVVRMTTLIDNVLDFARGRLGGGIEISLNATEPLEVLLKQVVDEFEYGNPSGRIVTNFELKEPVRYDKQRIGQLVSNLLGNALTHGAEDQPVCIHASTEGHVLKIEIANAGAPISEKAMRNLFKPFFRDEVRESQQGLGLGLYIASEIAKAHGGTLTVMSTEQETRFTFAMPLQFKVA